MNGRSAAMAHRAAARAEAGEDGVQRCADELAASVLPGPPIKVIHTLGSVASELAGPSYSVPRLAAALAPHVFSADVITLGATQPPRDDGVRVHTYHQDPTFGPLAKLGRSRAMRQALLTSDADLFHTHGLWMMPNVYPGEAARRLNRPFMLAPRGMLGAGALQFSSGVKRAFWAIWQKRAVDVVSCFHATAPSEVEDIRAYGLRQPAAIIPNGIDLPDLSALDCPATHAASKDDPFILSLGRIHPKKGLDRLIAAFARIADAHPSVRLRIIGPDEGGHADELRRQAQAADLETRVSIEAPLLGAEKFHAMRTAQVFALSTQHENFAMTVAESLAVETPVISTFGAPWQGLTEHRCGWWIDHGPDAMAAALRQALAMPPAQRATMGERGRAWMQRDFAWEGIAIKLAHVYAWLLKRGPKPAWIVDA
ncbi:MAG: glycosyltransferase [Pseudomonadota bacterium]